MVTGGYGSSYLDSTEIFSDNAWRTVAAKLPFLMRDLRAATINNRVLSFGNSLFFRIKIKFIFQVGIVVVEFLEIKF